MIDARINKFVVRQKLGRIWVIILELYASIDSWITVKYKF